MTKTQSKKKPLRPKASRPHMPGYGITKSKKGMLSWKWATDRLSKSHQYWIATTRPNGAPHVMVIWGLWMQDGFYFSTGKTSRKARNLAKNPHCVICSDNSSQAVIVEGTVEVIAATNLAGIYAAYKKKYKIDVSGMEEPLYRVRPRTVFGLFEKKFVSTATRWKFV